MPARTPGPPAPTDAPRRAGGLSRQPSSRGDRTSVHPGTPPSSVSPARVAVQVWSSLDRQTAIRPLADAVARHAGPDAVDLISTYFRLGNREQFTGLFTQAGLSVTDVRRLPATVRAPTIDDYITTEVESTPRIERISDDVYRKIRDEARGGLAPYCDVNGTLALPLEAFLVAARRG